jgi:hypothetical protein
MKASLTRPADVGRIGPSMVLVTIALAIACGTAAGLFGVLGMVAVVAVTMCVVALVVCVQHPEWGLYAVALSMPLETLSPAVAGFHPKVYQACLVFALVGLLVRGASRRDTIASVEFFPLLPLALTVLVTELIHWRYLSVGLSLVGLQFIFFALFLAIGAYRGQVSVLVRVAWCLVVSGALEGVVGLVQLTAFYTGAGSAAPGFLAYHDLLQAGRASGTFTEPDFFAAYLVMTLALGAGLRPRLRPGTVRRMVLDVSLVGMTACLLLALVRAAWVALICAVLIFWTSKLFTRERLPKIARARTWVLLLGLFSGLTLAFALAFPRGFDALAVRGRNLFAVVEMENGNSATRQIELDGLYTAISESPIVGHGMGTYGLLTDYGRTVAATVGRDTGVPGEAHLLGILYEHGLIGLAAIAPLLILVLARLRAALRGGGESAVLARAVGMAATAVAVTGLFNNDYYFGFSWIILAVAAAVTYDHEIHVPS